MKDAVNVTIKVTDEAGRKIPYVTVWAFYLKASEHHKSRRSRLQELNSEDLWRLTSRHFDTHELVSMFGDKPVPGLGITALGNEDGMFAEEMDYTDLTGVGNDYARPDPLVFGYTFMKRGYVPGRLDFKVPKSQTRVEGSVVLKRNLAEPVETAPYAAAFERLRYELSLPQDRRMTLENRRRIQAFGERFEQAAQDALAAGDKRAAARIYLRMRHLPSITRVLADGTEISGFANVDFELPNFKRGLDRAFELDPDNHFVWMNTIDRRGGVTAADPQERRVRRNLDQLEKLVGAHGERAWPRVYDWRAGTYEVVGDYAKARELYLQAAQLEPRFTDWDEQLSALKRTMRRLKVPVPADW